MRVLLIEDDDRIAAFIKKGLEEAGYSISHAPTGSLAQELIAAERWDLFIIDIMLPDLDGYKLTQSLRLRKNETPVLILSALGEPEDRVKALDLGADDYLVKPFHFPELLSRVNALYRRYHRSYDNQSHILTHEDLIVNKETHTVKRGDKDINLSTKELKLLVLLLENKGKVVSRTQIISHVWSADQDIYTNVIDVYISYLRNKVDAPFAKKLIRTIVGRGYLIDE